MSVSEILSQAGRITAEIASARHMRMVVGVLCGKGITDQRPSEP